MLTENEMLQSMRFRSEVSLQITLDQDYNIPDNKADMEKMVVEIIWRESCLLKSLSIWMG